MRPLDEGSVTDVRFGDPDRTSAAESNERTNERTDVEVGDVSPSGALSRRERAYQGFDTDEIRLGHVLAAGDLWRESTERHPRVRIGARSPIASHVCARAYRRAWDADGTDLTWHQRDRLTSWPHIAYCAHCDAPGMTSAVL